jgi:hypothetical protein
MFHDSVTISFLTKFVTEKFLPWLEFTEPSQRYNPDTLTGHKTHRKDELGINVTEGRGAEIMNSWAWIENTLTIYRRQQFTREPITKKIATI